MGTSLHRNVFAAIFVLITGATAIGQSPAVVQAAVEALQAGDGDKAAALFATALRDSPSDPRLLFGAGVAAHLRGRNDEAKRTLERALQVEPRFTAAAAMLGQVVYEQGDLSAAIGIYEKALTYAPTSAGLIAKLKIWREEAAKERRVDGPYTISFEGPAQGELAARATKVLDRAYWRLGAALGAYPPDQIDVVFYTLKQFRAATGAPEWSDGGFDTKIRVPVRGALATPAQFDRVLTHELAHAMIAAIAPRGVPAWMHEGLATVLEPTDPAEAERRLRASRLVVPLSNLDAPFTTLTAAQARVAYDESLVAAGLLLQRFGKNTCVLLGNLGRGDDLPSAFSALGWPFAEFERELEASVR